jgi:hypothetical protein
VVKYLNFHNSSFGSRYFLNGNGKAKVWLTHTPCSIYGQRQNRYLQQILPVVLLSCSSRCYQEVDRQGWAFSSCSVNIYIYPIIQIQPAMKALLQQTWTERTNFKSCQKSVLLLVLVCSSSSSRA